ncbi:hypothetical protein [Marinicrinis sediminis]|uniref:UDP-N-acetylglucosamine 2-epimerase domain-containing protein n=1 Tax=Marinicrinis sediminis TaxID=1652465 RepID=A0ABW5R7I4_9BACL
MFGGDHISPYVIMKYGLTQEFFELFHPISYCGVEIPLFLMRNFHQYIEPMLRQWSEDVKLTQQKCKQYRHHTFPGMQQVLDRSPQPALELTLPVRRQRVLLPGRIAYVATRSLSRHAVTLLISNSYDVRGVRAQKLPRHFKIWNFRNQFLNIQIPPEHLQILKQRMNVLFQKHAKHPVFGLPAFQDWMRKQTTFKIRQLAAADYLLRSQPIGVILDYDTSVIPGDILTLLAAKYQIPYVFLQYHMPMFEPLFPFRASYYCMWGKNYREWLEDKGVPADKIREIGSIRFEGALKGKWMSRTQLCNRFHIPRHHLIIAYTAQTHLETNRMFLSWLMQASQHLPVTIMLKLHPKDTHSYDDFLSTYSQIRLYPSSLSLYHLLNGMDVLATVNSTTAVEAAMFKKGIIVLQSDTLSDPYDLLSTLAKAKAGFTVQSVQMLREKLQLLINSEEAKASLAAAGTAFLHNMIRVPGSPANRVRSMVDHLLRKPTDGKEESG